MNKYNHCGRFTTVFIIIVLLTNICNGQNKLITLREALKLVETNYPLAKAKANYTRGAEFDVKEARREYIPSLKLHQQLDYATTNALQGTYLTMGLVPSVSAPILPENSYNPVYGSVTLGALEWDPYTFGKRNAKLDMTKAAYSSTLADEQNSKLSFQAAAAEAYLNLIVLNRLRELQQLNLQRTSLILSVVRAGAISGLKSGTDSAFACAEESRAKLQLNEAYRNEQAQKIILAQWMGLDSLNFSIDTTALLSEANINGQVINIKATEHPLAKFYESRVTLAEAKTRYVQRSYWPDLKLQGYGWGRGSGISPTGQRYGDFQDGTQLQRYNYLAAVSLTFNVLDYSRIRASYHAEQERRMALKEEYNAGLTQITNTQAIADVQMNLALKQLQEVPVQLASATAAFQQTKARYNSGLATLTELTQILYNLNRAETDALLASSSFWKALLYKAAAGGDINYFIQNLK